MNPTAESLQAIDIIVAEMRVLWPPPKSVKTDADAAIYLKAWTQAVLDETIDPTAIADAWRNLKRLHQFPCWPTPGELCKLIRDTKRDQGSRSPPSRTLTPPDYINERWTPEQWQRHLASMRAAHDALAAGTTIMIPVLQLGEAMMGRQERIVKGALP